MEKEKVYQMTNDFGRNYLQSWHKNDEFLGIEIPKDNIRKEFYLVYRYSTGEIAVTILPLKESKNDGCCSFGDLNYFAMVFAHNFCGINILWNPIYSNRCVFPRWRNDVSDEKKEEFHKTYCSILEKYS